MSHLLVAPIAIPAIAAALLVLLHRFGLDAARWVSAAATLAFLASAVALFDEAAGGTLGVYALGSWPAPFGIVLVLDRLSAAMVLLTALLASAVLTYAVQGWDARGRFFHAFFQFQLMGLAGAFLTGDLFNLFVFFEVMLIASYCLMLQGLGPARVRATLHYVALNMTASGVFLIAVSLLYGVTGTLNMAHLAERVAQLSPENAVLARAAGMLLIGVFCVKAALVPFYFWLPAGYANAAAPVAALFSIMTKVGVYSIVRVTTLVYGGGASPDDLLSPWLLPLALATLAIGALGALGAQRLTTMVAYLTVASVGTMLAAVAAGGTNGLAAAIYYLAHSTVAIAILFLLADLLSRQRGALADVLHGGPPIARSAALGLAFLMAGASIAGIPPFSGFVGKLMVLQSVQGTAAAPGVWIEERGARGVSILACVRAGSLVLWRVSGTPESTAEPRTGEWVAVAALFACGALLVALAGPVTRYAGDAAAQAASPRAYIDAVLGSADVDRLRPLPGARHP
ncbi:MAG: monovalent cation/H+ antiporter subunit D [Burkholderiales bacterium]